MTLYEFCNMVVHVLKLGDSELRITSQASGEYVFIGTFNDFMERTDFTVGFLNSRVLGVSMFLSTNIGEEYQYATMISI